MSSNENDVKNNLQNDKKVVFKKELVETATRIAVTSFSVATILYPLKVFETRIQTGMTKGFSFSPFLFNYKNLQPLINGFLTANKASLTKNSVLANRETISNQVDHLMGDKEAKAKINYSGLFITAGIITTLDTLSGQYYANTGVLNSLGYGIPQLNSKQKLRFASIGLIPRGMKNFAVTCACISAATSAVHNPITGEKNLLINALITNTLFAFLVSPFIAVEIIYKRKIAGINLQTLQTPTYPKVIKTMWQEGGVRTFFRGSLFNGVYTSLAFLTINGVGYLMDNYLFSPHYQVENKSTFFAPKTVANAEEKTQQAGEKLSRS